MAEAFPLDRLDDLEDLVVFFGEALSTDVLRDVLVNCGNDLQEAIIILSDMCPDLVDYEPPGGSTSEQTNDTPNIEQRGGDPTVDNVEIPKGRAQSTGANKRKSKKRLTVQMKQIYNYHTLGYRTMIIIRGRTQRQELLLVNRILQNTIMTNNLYQRMHVVKLTDYLTNDVSERNVLEIAINSFHDAVFKRCRDGVSPVIIVIECDNFADIKPFFDAAAAFGYYVEDIRPPFIPQRVQFVDQENIMNSLSTRYRLSAITPNIRIYPPLVLTQISMRRDATSEDEYEIDQGDHHMQNEGQANNMAYNNEEQAANLFLDDEIEVSLGIELIGDIADANICYDECINPAVRMGRGLLNALWTESVIYQMDLNSRQMGLMLNGNNAENTTQETDDEETVNITLSNEVVTQLCTPGLATHGGFATNLIPQVNVYKSVLRSLWNQTVARHRARTSRPSLPTPPSPASLPEPAFPRTALLLHPIIATVLFFIATCKN